jgi:hypothetical protein
MELGFIARITAAALDGLKKAIAIVFLFVFLIVMVKWLSDHPAQRAAMGNKLGDALTTVVVGICNLIISGINAISS